MMENHNEAHMLVTGHVQGVGFRYFVQQQAQALELTGWVRNRFDDKVEILAQGTTQNLQRLIDTVHVGPGHAVVTDLEVDWQEARQTFTRFSIAPTL